MIPEPLRTVLTPGFKALSFITKPVFGDFAAPLRAEDPEHIRFNFAALADVHVDWRSYRWRRLSTALRDMEHSYTPIDALVTLGDTTDHGEPDHWEMAEWIFMHHKPAKELIFAIGNHDTWTHEEECGRKFEDLFIEYSEKICNRKLDKVYFYTEVKGYPFVSLGSESDCLNADISDEQLKWFEETMEKAAATGKPIFVLCHQALNQTHGLPKTFDKDEDYKTMDEGGIGDASDKVKAIMKKYKNVFYMSGHSHMGLNGKYTQKKKGYCTIEHDGSLHLFNLPCFMFWNHHGIKWCGLGMQFEVYDDKVVVRPRSYASRLWYSMYRQEIALEK